MHIKENVVSRTFHVSVARAAVVAVATLMIFAGIAPLHAQAIDGGTRVAVIDVRRILTESEAGRAAVEVLRQLAETKQAEISELDTVAQEVQARLEAGRLSLSEEKIKEVEQELQGMMIQLRRTQDDARREMEELQVQEFGAVEERVMPLIRSLGQELGYSLIFNKFEESGLLFAAPGVDITDLVIERFDLLAAEGGEG